MTQTIETAVILAAGRGTRLQPFTFDIPKGFMPVGNERLIERSVRILKENGIKNMNGAVNYLLENQHVLSIGSIGWCFGGGESLNLALNNDMMDATIIYYGRLATDTEELSSISWPEPPRNDDILGTLEM